MSTEPPKSGIRAALEYTGIPKSWLSKRPKLPSRNWLIFLTVTSSLTGLFVYDRRQCKKIRQEYIDKVKHLSEETPDHLSYPRKVTVYGSKWPGDEDHDQSMRYFRNTHSLSWSLPAVDYEMVNGKRHGDLATRIADEVKKRRRLDLGLDSPADRAGMPPRYTWRTKEQLREQELNGELLDIVDHDEELSKELEADGRCIIPSSTLPYKQSPSLPPPSPASAMDVPATIPALPPILLVSFVDYVGIKLVPHMIWDWMNRRHHVRAGAEAGYRLVMANTRPINPPATKPLFSDITNAPTPDTDVDFDKAMEGYFKSSLQSTPSDIERSRKKYYEQLPAKLVIARELARNVREPTSDEVKYPPPTEVELRAERMTKEKRWRKDLRGWEIVKPSQEVPWDPRFENALTIFIDPPKESEYKEELSANDTQSN
ncbi:inner membrane protein import complex subunit Tim54-domain-containing protein [Desarmillaria tabescens]|uniref:Mitochondrial import inner membrane translocase subunit TIM54 n=1 Tax=Armillaria tabescens TaxID=1929756 RepID=A0AA39KCS3_ARMTA|nr:inner membrane protein import complex subunit Tim54-domain-containing protein [Desarmillaria tabescens]KAK0458781.1 inner membrane protein import complex subunit Tim54-domain-containing protein [Desarmillaria tabescens]